MRTTFKYAVVGCGGIGSAVAYWLARIAGEEVLGLEQFRLGHDHGASQDHSRIIRLSYHAPEYTALTPHTYDAWAEVEEESGVQLVFKTGSLDIAAADSIANLLPYTAAMDAANIPYERLSAAEAMARFPQVRLREGEIALYQSDGGLVDPRKANATHVALARARGATIFDQTPVRRLIPSRDGVAIETDGATFHADRVVIAADAWTNDLLGPLDAALPLTVTQEQVTFFATPHLREFAPDRFPIWIWHGPDSFYGFPVYGEVATKAGLDVGGDVVTTATRTYDPNPRPYQKLVNFLEERIPGSLGPVLYTKTCLYSMPPDRNFILGRLPHHRQILVAQGAAHGFKFASLIGKIMAELATEDGTAFPIAPFRIDRPALTDPAFELALHI